MFERGSCDLCVLISGSFCFLPQYFESIRGDIASSPPGLETLDAFGGPLECEDHGELLAELLVSLPTYLHAHEVSLRC